MRRGILDRAHLHKHMLRQLLSVWQVMVQVLTRHRGRRAEGGGAVNIATNLIDHKGCDLFKGLPLQCHQSAVTPGSSRV